MFYLEQNNMKDTSKSPHIDQNTMGANSTIERKPTKGLSQSGFRFYL